MTTRPHDQPPHAVDPSRLESRDRFVRVCARHGVDAALADALWRDLTGVVAAPATSGRLSRTGRAAVAAGTVLLSAAGIWWASLVNSAAGAPGLLALGLGWVVAAGVAAELARRRVIASLDAAFSVIAVAYAGVAAAAAMRMLAGSAFAAHWWGRQPVELVLLGAGGLAVWRYRQPLLTMPLPTIAAGALSADALISSFDGWDRDITRWPAWAAFAALGLAIAVTFAAVTLDRRGMRPPAMWPSLLADVATIAAVLGIAAAEGAASTGMGLALALAAAVVFARGALVGRLAQVAIGAGIFWLGVILVGSRWGDLAIAGLTTLAGVSVIAGAVLVTRRGGLVARRRGRTIR
ncbi:MAG TPA: hypothetical protein VMU66_08710 [Gaiellales bacterium]|nr:hypothetical protein [Gaiellales bacterium]